ncbi:MAG: transposase family protein [Firmicutes bacterium]|nr:transposase family protein [Bacillota bacterium]
MAGRKSKMAEIEARFGEPIETLIRHYYYEREYTLDQLAKLFGVSRATVSVWMLKLGLPTRNWKLPDPDNDRRNPGTQTVSLQR